MMMLRLRYPSMCVILAAVSTAACIDEGEPAVGSDQEEVIVTNGLTLNGLTLNGLTLNGLTLNGLTLNGLTLNGLPLTSGDIANVKVLLKYTVECAIPSGSSISVRDVNGSMFPLYGSLGLAPGWATGPLDVNGQEAVSACLLARSNAAGKTLSISLRGKWPSLSTDLTEAITYLTQEGAFWGNLFSAPAKMYACYSRNETCASIYGRLCSSSTACGFVVVGMCDNVCVEPKQSKGMLYDYCTAPEGRWYNIIRTSLPQAVIWDEAGTLSCAGGV
jgi:hypothetical protein